MKTGTNLQSSAYNIEDITTLSTKSKVSITEDPFRCVNDSLTSRNYTVSLERGGPVTIFLLFQTHNSSIKQRAFMLSRNVWNILITSLSSWASINS